MVLWGGYVEVRDAVCTRTSPPHTGNATSYSPYGRHLTGEPRKEKVTDKKVNFIFERV